VTKANAGQEKTWTHHHDVSQFGNFSGRRYRLFNFEVSRGVKDFLLDFREWVEKELGVRVNTKISTTKWPAGTHAIFIYPHIFCS
jgi:hypothetical protein